MVPHLVEGGGGVGTRGAWHGGANLWVPAPGQARKLALIGALDYAADKLIVHRSRSKRRTDFIALLERLDPLFGPRLGRLSKPVVLVVDNGPIHTSKLTRAALAHQTFASVHQLDNAVALAVDQLNEERSRHLCPDQRIAA